MDVAARNGIDLGSQRARKIRTEDFSRFDFILGMDWSNVMNLTRMAPSGSNGSIHLFLQFSTGRDEEIPDPYHGGPDGFDRVYRIIREASELLATKLA